MWKLRKLTANGLLFPTAPAKSAMTVSGVMLVAGPGAAAACDIREGGAGGTIVCSLAAPPNQSDWFAVDGPFVLTDPYLDNLTGAGSSLTFAG